MTPSFGPFLSYPDAGLMASMESSAGSPGLSQFAERARPLGLHGLEELYTRTFDMNPSCSLEVGWHLFGEQYERGAFLVKMRENMRRFGIPENHELPDHLSHALAVLERMEGEEARRFAADALAPALKKILEGLKDESNPYRPLLAAVADLVSGRAAEGAGV